MKQLLIWAVTFASCSLNHIYCNLNNYEGFDISQPPKRQQTEDEEVSSCPEKNGKHPVYLPHPTDCNKFYICDNGNRYFAACLPGLHFNTGIKTCDYPESAGCDKDPSNLPLGRRIDDDNLKMCPTSGNSNHPVYIPHPNECNKFYICDRLNNPHQKTCPAGLHFNPKLKICDYPESAGCDKGTSEDPNSKAKEDEDFSLCPAKNTEEPTHIPHPSDCNKFYICDNGTPHVQTCQLGLYFNPKINTCDYPKNVDCNAGSAIAFSGIPSSFCPPITGNTLIFYRHSTNCSVFYLCGNGLAYEFACPAKLHFNLRRKICDYEEDANCQS